MEIEKELRSMQVGERMKFDIWDVWKVPGGWLFSMGTGESYHGTFVSDVQLHFDHLSRTNTEQK